MGLLTLLWLLTHRRRSIQCHYEPIIAGLWGLRLCRRQYIKLPDGLAKVALALEELEGWVLLKEMEISHRHGK